MSGSTPTGQILSDVALPKVSFSYLFSFRFADDFSKESEKVNRKNTSTYWEVLALGGARPVDKGLTMLKLFFCHLKRLRK